MTTSKAEPQSSPPDFPAAAESPTTPASPAGPVAAAGKPPAPAKRPPTQKGTADSGAPDAVAPANPAKPAGKQAPPKRPPAPESAVPAPAATASQPAGADEPSPPSSEAAMAARAARYADAEAKSLARAESFAKARLAIEARLERDDPQQPAAQAALPPADPDEPEIGMKAGPNDAAKPEFNGLVDLRDNRVVAPPRSPRRRWLMPLLCIGLPTLLTLIYLGLIASPRYSARVLLTIKSTNSTPSISSFGLGNLGLNFGGGAADQDARMISAYLTSADLFAKLNDKTKLVEHWSSSRNDWFFRLTSHPSAEVALDYYLSRSTVTLDPDSGFITYEIQAYDRDYAVTLANEVLRLTENAVNQLGHDLTKDRLASFDDEVENSEKAMRAAAQALLTFQSESKVPNAKGTVEAVSAMLVNVNAAQIQAEAEIAGMLATHGEDNPAVATARARIAALKQQSNELADKLIHTDGIGKLAFQQAELEAELKLRAQAHEVSLAAREQALVELSHKLKQLIVIDPPRTPEDASNPRIIYLTITAFVVSALAYAIIGLLLATIREHSD